MNLQSLCWECRYLTVKLPTPLGTSCSCITFWSFTLTHAQTNLRLKKDKVIKKLYLKRLSSSNASSIILQTQHQHRYNTKAGQRLSSCSFVVSIPSREFHHKRNVQMPSISLHRLLETGPRDGERDIFCSLWVGWDWCIFRCAKSSRRSIYLSHSLEKQLTLR